MDKLVGLLNGPLFTKFTFREIGISGSVLVFLGLFSSAWSTNFIEYIISISITYGIGLGLSQESSTLALITFFKKKRREATGYSLTISGIGSLAFPQLAVFGLAYFGYIGTVINFTGISLFLFISAICYRPALQFSKVDPSIEMQKEGTEMSLATNTKEIEKKGLFKKIIETMELDLLKDKSLLNLLIGISMILFAEANFFVLAPFILGEAGFADQQISFLMSTLAGVDIILRFLTPLVTQKLPLSNKSLFAIGVTFISIGSVIIVSSNNFNVILFAYVLLGIGKALRIITRPLLVVDYVPLKKAAAADGLRSVMSFILFITVGPLVGLIKQYWHNEVFVYILTVISMICLLSWGIEKLIWRFNDKKKISPRV